VNLQVHFRNLPGTEAAVGWAGAHTLVADRPNGKAGGLGLGFNGGQLLALALGGCFCNDLRYSAEHLGAALGEISVDVSLEFEGQPLVATAARMEVHCTMKDGSDPKAVFEHARANCTVSNSLRQGVAVEIDMSA
jgi:organic hydroperoxide reductase OsmC/OhrA